MNIHTRLHSALIVAVYMFLFCCHKTSAAERPEVELEDILAKPEIFAEKRVKFRAYFRKGDEVSALYPDASLKHQLYNGLWMDSDSFRQDSKVDKPVEGWFSVVGKIRTIGGKSIDRSGIVLDLNGFGHLGKWRSRIVDVTTFSREKSKRP